jgi:imidazolonepropionase
LDLIDEFEFTTVDGLEWADHNAARKIAESGAIATLTPASTFFLGLRRAPARELIALGVPVAIASNFSRIATPAYNMQMVIFLACHQLGMSPAEAVAAATINGAHALKLGHRLGSLESGKQADLLILSVGDYRELAHEFGGNLVNCTLKRGAVVFERSAVKWPAD